MGEQTSIWTKIETITQIGILIFAVVAVIFAVAASNTANDISKSSLALSEQSNILTQLANNLTQASLRLQEIQSNFEPLVYPYDITAKLQDITTENGTETWRGRIVDDRGSLNISLVVITPHAAIVSFNYTSFNFTALNPQGNDGTVIDPNNWTSTYAFVNVGMPLGMTGNYYSDYLHSEAFAPSGVNLLYFAFPVSASFALNPQLTNNSIILGGSIGTFDISVNMLDVQTRNSTVWNFVAYLRVNVNGYDYMNIYG